MNLLNLDEKELIAWCREAGEPSYRAQQLMKWIHFFGQTDFTQMMNLSKKLRTHLMAHATITPPEIALETQAKDGTIKWLLKLSCGNLIETVFIPEKKRGTLCVSSQVGCALNCRFCSTGKQGFNRNLTVAEIIGQVWIAARALSEKAGMHDGHITNIVMMGMGEPLLNFDAVTKALSIMLSDHAYGISKRRLTLSTSGIVPEMQRLAETLPVSLAVSLHAPNDRLRDILVPINKKYPLALLMETCRTYFQKEPRRKILFEYVMLEGVNDDLNCAKEVVRLLSDVPAKLNLIPFNSFKGTIYKASSPEAVSAFQAFCLKKGLHTTVRKTRGQEVDAACGQLVGNFRDRTRRSKEHEKSIMMTSELESMERERA